MDVIKVGIIGCGVISQTYIRDIRELYQESGGVRLELAACGDVDMEKARECAEKYHIPEYGLPEALLKKEDLQILINLTPPRFHFELNKQILEAGKHLFCEKPFALTTEQAAELKALAEKKNLNIGSAPDTFLGAGLSRSRYLLDMGVIGKPLYVTANMMSYGVETWHPSPAQFYSSSAGPLYDMGPYYLTALAVMLGPVESIQAVSGTGFSERMAYCGGSEGKGFPVETPTYYAALLRMKNGVLVNLTVSFDIWKSGLPFMEIYGQEGTLCVPDPNMSEGMPVWNRKEDILNKVLPPEHTMPSVSMPTEEMLKEYYPSTGEYTRGAGVLDLAYAIISREENRAGAKLAVHVTEAINGIMQAARSGEIYHMRTECSRPAPLKKGLQPGKIA